MQYRTFGKDKRRVSVLGFGCMRFPTNDGTMTGIVDEEESKRILRYGIDNGINYVDTAKVYLNGTGEAIVGRCLAGGYREKVSLATKLPTWAITSIQDADKIFDEQRRDLQTEKIDMYLIHNLQQSFRGQFYGHKLADWAYKKKEKGQIDYVGFSFHDDFAFFKEIVDSFDKWDFCQLQYNYTGEFTQAGKQGAQYAAEKGLSLVVMEPLLGGTLAQPSAKLGALFAENKQFNPVDLGLRWLWNQPEPTVVLSGMSSFEQVRQNIDIAAKGTVGNLTDSESAFIEELKAVYSNSKPVKCTKCEYCKKDCPKGIDIPKIFELYNNFIVCKSEGKSESNWGLFKILYGAMPTDVKADLCIQCGNCESLCPQHLTIRKYLETAHAALI
ncbi:aldo/keto reductase [Planctomycetales bacterium]|nr:aldo/keto reductase [Planctomycetales bacterium]